MGVALYGSYNQPCNSNFVTFANGEHNWRFVSNLVQLFSRKP
jgi:hypothetical protein